MSDNPISPLLSQHIKPFEKYFKIKGLVELCINQPGEIWIETLDGWTTKKDDAFSLRNLNHFAEVLATSKGQKFSNHVPLLSTSLPGYGYRVQVVGGALVSSGFSLSIRVAQAQRFELTSYMSDSEALKLQKLIKDGKTILVAGGTSSGKTTLLNSMIRFIPNENRIITIEDTQELEIDQPNNIRILKSKTGTDIAQMTYKDIINSCMRMRPDRLLMGELDIDNTVPFLRLLNTGHAGCMATIHADGPEESIDAIVMNARLSGLVGPVEDYTRKAIDSILFIERKDRRTFEARMESI